MIVAIVDQIVVIPYRQVDNFSTAPYVYAGFTTLEQENLNTLSTLFKRKGSGTVEDPYKIEAKYSLYSLFDVSAFGVGAGSGGGGSMVNILDSWDIYDTSKEMWALSARLGKSLLDGKKDNFADDYYSKPGHKHSVGDITGLENLSTLLDWFEWDEDNQAIRVKYSFYSIAELSAFGVGGSGSGGGGGYDMITDWAQYVSGKETNVVSAQLLYADHLALADKAPLSHNHDSLYLKLSGGTLTGTLVGTNATFSSYVNALGFALGAYAPYGYRFYQNDSSFAFGMYGESGIYKLQAAYQGTNSYTDFTRGFRVFNTTDNYEEFYTGKGRLELTRVMSSSSEFSSLDNGIKLDKAVLSFYQLGVGNSYARVLDIGAFGRTDYGYYGNNAESIIRFLYNTSGAYSGGVEAARFWRGSFQLGFTGNDYLAYKLAVNGNSYISGSTIVGGNFYGYGIGSFSGMVLGTSFKTGNWEIIPISTTQLQIQFNGVMVAKLDSAGNILATGNVTAYAI